MVVPVPTAGSVPSGEGVAAVPEGTLLYAVGDIHGRSDLLDRMLDEIAHDAAAAGDATTRILVFLGDYVDRGPDSHGVVERLVSGLPEGFETHCLKGNHEGLLLDFLDDPASLELWLYNGAETTLRSYGVDVDALARERSPAQVWRDRFAERLPDAHRAFLESLALSATFGDYFFAHAGVRPALPLDGQRAQDLIWIREPFLGSDQDFGKVVVHGHTPGPEPVVRYNRIGIDTGAWTTGRLTALRLHGHARRFLHTV